MHRRPRALTVGLLAICLTVLAVAAGSAGAYGPVGTQLRISSVEPEGDHTTDGRAPAVAYNVTNAEYLVVWGVASSSDPSLSEIYGQRIDTDGTEIGGDFKISSAGPEEPDPEADDFTVATPAIAWHPGANQYLVAWTVIDDDPSGDPAAVWGRYLTGNGSTSGDEFQLSPTPALDRSRTSPTISAATSPDRYLITWENAPDSGGGTEIFGRIVSTDGTLDPAFEISSPDTTPGHADRAGSAQTAFNALRNEFLVVWHENPFAAEQEFEIFGQRLNASGEQIGTDDFRISTTGTDGDERFAVGPALAFNPGATPDGAYLVAWAANGGSAPDEFEVFGQRLAGLGAKQGGAFQISDLGGDGATRLGTLALDYSSVPGEYFVSWSGDGLETENELEIFGQRLSPAGAEIGGELRLSTIGDDGNVSREALGPALAYNPTTDEYLATYEGDNDEVLNENEIWGHRLNLGAMVTLTVEKMSNGSGTVTSSPAGVNCGADCSASFLSGTQVMLTQEAEPGSAAAGWEQCDLPPDFDNFDGPCWMNMNAGKTVQAFFNAQGGAERTLTVTVNGPGTVTGNGIACPGDCSEAFGNGTIVNLTATPGTGASFSGWGGACSGTGGCSVTMSANQSVSGAFAAAPDPGPGPSPPPGTAPPPSTAPPPATIPGPDGAACDDAQQKLKQAKKKVRKAKKELEQAEKSGGERKVEQAKQKLKQAKKKVRKAKAKVDAAC